MADNFKPDASIKRFFMEISTPKLIDIINGLCKTDYPRDAEVIFENTEHFTVLGAMDKESVRGDLTVKVNTSEHRETTNTIVIEFQSTKDESMGFRLFVYSLNGAEYKQSTGNEKEKVYIFPKGATLYTTLDLPKEGVDQVHMQIERFRVGDNLYTAENGDLLTVEFPFVNVLAMNAKEFVGSKLESLQVIYPYKYKKNPKLLKNVEEIEDSINQALAYSREQEGQDKLIVGGVLDEILADVSDICKRNQEEYGKVVEYMETANLSCAQILIAESMAKGEAIGTAIGEARGEVRGEARGKAAERRKNILNVYRLTENESLIYDSFDCDAEELEEILSQADE